MLVIGTQGKPFMDFTNESVSGSIIGDITFCAKLFYEGRPQRQTIYAKDHLEALSMAEAILQNIKDECGEAFRLIYPNQSWELRLYV